jgi:hypothetical protein
VTAEFARAGRVGGAAGKSDGPQMTQISPQMEPDQEKITVLI